MAFELNQRVRRVSDGCPGIVTEADSYVHVRFEDHSEHHYLSDGSSCCGAPGPIEPLTMENPVPADFKMDQRVTYHLEGGTSAEGVIVLIDEHFIHVKLDEGQPGIRYAYMPRVFDLGGNGIGRFVAIPEGTRTSDRGDRIVKALPAWEPTKGREYPAKPYIAYGAFDTYYGRPIEPGNPRGEPVTIGWGVLCSDTRFTQLICDTKERAEANGYLDQAMSLWKDAVYDIDLAAIENPFDVLLGCEVRRAWIQADNFGMEVYLPDAPRSLAWVSFNYAGVLCTSGLIAFDELNQFFENEVRGLKVEAVDGQKLTVGETEFYVVPKLRENFKPTIAPDGTNTKLKLLQNLAMQSAARDSALPLAA